MSSFQPFFKKCSSKEKSLETLRRSVKVFVKLYFSLTPGLPIGWLLLGAVVVWEEIHSNCDATVLCKMDHFGTFRDYSNLLNIEFSVKTDI